jgi:hypothetical protein
VPRAESLAAMRRADVLLLVQNTEAFSAETIPSKTYEYFRSGRPVLGLVHRNPELAAMLEAGGHAAADADDPASVKAALPGLLRDWDHGGHTDAAPATRPHFAVADAVERLVALAAGLRPRAAGRRGGA